MGICTQYISAHTTAAGVSKADEQATPDGWMDGCCGGRASAMLARHANMARRVCAQQQHVLTVPAATEYMPQQVFERSPSE